MVKAYFNYKLVCCCGIPKATLEDFWGRVISMQMYSSGGETNITGWRAGTALHSNFIDSDDFPDGIIGVSFTTDDTHPLKFAAGFVGINQEILENLSGESVVSPVIGWAIIDEKDSPK
ncbi:21267_t:CDS:2 [Dentiscutata erythropus]|uniref:21267_t:CDS:1 n=1 Tax=Dentiscutata erythropus TaxID=1348616 RepID=A0A9N8W0S7_9GLOM|nr:21267_t:CDS:2 [Dentiscutata erythropus]